MKIEHKEILLALINIQMQPFGVHFDHLPAYQYNVDYETTKAEILSFRKKARAYLREIGVPKSEQDQMINSFLQDYKLNVK